MEDPWGREGRLGIVTEYGVRGKGSKDIGDTCPQQKALYYKPNKEDKGDPDPVLEISTVQLLTSKYSRASHTDIIQHEMHLKDKCIWEGDDMEMFVVGH